MHMLLVLVRGTFGHRPVQEKPQISQDSIASLAAIGARRTRGRCAPAQWSDSSARSNSLAVSMKARTF